MERKVLNGSSAIPQWREERRIIEVCEWKEKADQIYHER